MTDLHCHILPGIDDGAKNTDVSIELLSKEKMDGVDNIVFTSHFYPENNSLNDFLERRNNSFDRLMNKLSETDLEFNLKLGAEVYFSPILSEMDARKLCFENTDYMLIEFPTSHKPAFLEDVLYDLDCMDIKPIIAHIERYPYIMDDLNLLYKMVKSGLYIQTNAETILKKGKESKLILKLIKWNLVHLISTDTHSPDKRPPLMKEAFEIIENKLGKEVVYRLKNNSDNIFNNKKIEKIKIYKPKKILGLWR